MTGAEALRLALPRLQAAGIDTAARDARLLLAHSLGVAADRLTLHLPDPMGTAAVDAFDAAIAARVARQPVAQIIGGRLFWGRWFKVTGDTLDPRPETECLVQVALQRPFLKVLDLGTGTGCILLSCLADMPLATGVGCDISAAALAVATENGRALGLDHRVRWHQSDWFAAVGGQFDLIVSNPPYIAEAEMAGLSPEVANWEPVLALTPGGDGLEAYRRIARGAGAHLLPGGRLMLEIGPTQGQAVVELLMAQGFEAVQVLPDLDGRDRVVTAMKPVDAPGCGGV